MLSVRLSMEYRYFFPESSFGNSGPDHSFWPFKNIWILFGSKR